MTTTDGTRAPQRPALEVAAASQTARASTSARPGAGPAHTQRGWLRSRARGSSPCTVAWRRNGPPLPIKSRQILVCTGADDPFVPVAQVHALAEELTKAGVDW